MMFGFSIRAHLTSFFLEILRQIIWMVDLRATLALFSIILHIFLTA